MWKQKARWVSCHTGTEQTTNFLDWHNQPFIAKLYLHVCILGRPLMSTSPFTIHFPDIHIIPSDRTAAIECGWFPQQHHGVITDLQDIKAMRWAYVTQRKQRNERKWRSEEESVIMLKEMSFIFFLYIRLLMMLIKYEPSLKTRYLNRLFFVFKTVIDICPLLWLAALI